ncbi:FtsB family cell division protein [Vaginisenegalia massiliensis]|uniref:FtsB family cell division protein n=1 Tax=Vaginisenegalia massiliensis TaxID=2058294 RepID=UPI000F51EE08|nr:septum formation initiator family protein [Vaginisenegalia massiliensis]
MPTNQKRSQQARPNIIQLNQARSGQMGTKLSMTSSPKTRSFNATKRIALLGVVAVLITGVPLINTLAQSVSQNTKLEAAKAANKVAIQQNKEVADELQRLKDPSYLAEIARRDYYYSKEGEIIFDLGQDQDQNSIFNQQN